MTQRGRTRALMAGLARGARRLVSVLRTTILGSLLAAFVAVAVPLYAGGFALYSWGVNQVKNQLLEDAAAKSVYFLQDMDGELSRIRTQQTKLLQDRDIMRLAVLSQGMDAIERTEQMNRAQRRLLAVQDSSDLVEGALLHLPALGRTLQADASYLPLSAEQYAALEEEARAGVWAQDPPTLFMAYPQAGGAAAYMAQIRLSTAYFNRALSLLGDGCVLWDPISGRVLGQSGRGDANALSARLTGLTAPLNTPLIEPAADAWLILEQSPQSGLVLATWVPRQSIQEPLLRYRPYFWLFSAAAALLAAYFIGVVYRMAHRPLLQMVEAFGRVEGGDFSVAISHRHHDEFRYLYAGFNHMVQRLRQSIDQVYKQRIYAQQMELKQLQSQINPHFLYNSFFALQSMADAGDTDAVSEYTGLLGRYFQYITRNARTEAFLYEEAGHARNYATLQARRYRNRVVLHFGDLPESMAGEVVPKLLLQPILENAFEHGLKNKMAGGLVTVVFEDASDYYEIVVEDNGDELTDGELARMVSALTDEGVEVTGIVNVHRRLALGYGQGSGIRLTRGGGGGLRVTLRVIRREREGNDGPPADR